MKGTLPIEESKLLTVEKLREALNYNSETGVLTWKIKPCRNIIIGTRAGTLKRDGYRYIRFDNIEYLEHRLIWFGMTGKWPKNQIDHINLNKSDNRWINLREATVSQNGMNVSTKINNTTGHKGINKIKNGKFRARITINNREISLGCFNNVEDAIEEYKKAAKRYHGDFSRTG